MQAEQIANSLDESNDLGIVRQAKVEDIIYVISLSKKVVMYVPISVSPPLPIVPNIGTPAISSAYLIHLVQ